MLALTVIYFQVDYSFKDETDQERYVFWAHCKLNDILCYSLFWQAHMGKLQKNKSFSRYEYVLSSIPQISSGPLCAQIQQSEASGD